MTMDTQNTPSDLAAVPVPEGHPAAPIATPTTSRHLRFDTLSRVFSGSDGLRAGWKALLFLVVFLVVVLPFRPGVAWVERRLIQGFNVWYLLFSETVVFLQVAAATFLMAKMIDRRPWDFYGLPLRRAFGSRFWIGGLIGFLALVVQVAVMRAGGWFQFGPAQLHGLAAIRMGFYWGLAFIAVSLLEEFLFRGYLQQTLARGMHFWPAAIVLSGVFGVLHISNDGENWIGAAGVSLFGMQFVFMLRRTGDLWLPIGAHTGWNWGQTFFFGVPNSGNVAEGGLRTASFHGHWLLSGGTAGPEGSVFLFLSLGLMTAAVAGLYKRQTQIPVNRVEGS